MRIAMNSGIRAAVIAFVVVCLLAIPASAGIVTQDYLYNLSQYQVNSSYLLRNSSYYNYIGYSLYSADYDTANYAYYVREYNNNDNALLREFKLDRQVWFINIGTSGWNNGEIRNYHLVKDLKNVSRCDALGYPCDWNRTLDFISVSENSLIYDNANQISNLRYWTRNLRDQISGGSWNAILTVKGLKYS